MIHHHAMLTTIGVSMFVIFWQGPGQVSAQVSVDVGVGIGDGQPPPPPQGIEVLTRGPIHEAFAQPVIFDEGAGFVIARRPPSPLEEFLPDEKPEGNRIVWIPGYWSWDSDRDDFIWISGCWRAVPPNTGWVPGYWAQVRGGYQWISGFWTTEDIDEIEYLPPPPPTMEQGPQSPGFPDSIWIPGSWIRYQGRYVWRPGFWDRAQPNWVWVPAHYVCSPHGCIFVDGYWDYPLERRGVVFLPVYFPPQVYDRPAFRYSPQIVLNVSVLTLELFSSPRRRHYYFGDYYESRYSREGFHPWYEARDRHDWYDPIYVHQRWQHRDDRDWNDRQRGEYERRRDDKAIRPARTYDAMRAQTARLPENERRRAQVAQPIREVASDNTTPFKFERLDEKTRETSSNQARDVNVYKDKRSQWESPSVAPTGGTVPQVAAPEKAPAPEVTPPKEPIRAPAQAPPAAPQAGPQPKETPPARVPAPDVTPPREQVPAPVQVPSAAPIAPEPKEVAPTRVPGPDVAPSKAPPAQESPKVPEKKAPPAAQPPTPGRDDAAKEQPAAQDSQPKRVKVPKPPIAARQPVQDKDQAPPPKPKQPTSGPDAQQKPAKDAPDRSERPDRPKDDDPPGKDKRD